MVVIAMREIMWTGRSLNLTKTPTGWALCSKFFLQYAPDFGLYLCLHQRDWKAKPGAELQLTGRKGDATINMCAFEGQTIDVRPVTDKTKP